MGGSKKDLSAKAKGAASQRIIDDKTFGLKNKNKSKKVQAYVNQVVIATKASFVDQKKQKEENLKIQQKLDKKAKKDEEKALFKVAIIQPKVPFGVDPKTIACAYFKAGQCKSKGDKCKFSHDQEICFGKKKAVGNKIDLTADVKSKKKEEEDIAITDPEELAKAIAKKAAQMACETHIVCKHFLEAIDCKKYGWFWECPDNKDGNSCKYRHALPPGYVFKASKKKGDEDDDEEADDRSLEQKLDDMRKGVGPGAMVTQETFAEWKRSRLEKAEAVRLKAEEGLKAKFKKGQKAQLTGRQLFEFDASLFVDDAEASGADAYKMEFGDAQDMEDAMKKVAANQAERLKGCEPVEAPPAAAAAAPAAAVDLPEGIEENLFLDEDLDDLPSDDD